MFALRTASSSLAKSRASTVANLSSRPASKLAPIARAMATSSKKDEGLWEGRASQKLWGARFSRDTDESVKVFCDSLPCDEPLVVDDLWGSMAHVTMLGVQGVIAPNVAAGILPTLKGFQDEALNGTMNLFDAKFRNHDDVHMNMESRLIDKVGMDVGGRMHTTRSRNDQVIVDSKLFTRRRLLELRGRVLPIVETFLKRASQHTEDVMIGYTHVQHAQPISVGYWLSHYAAVFLRDLDRLKRAYDITDENPLGAGALAGTSFPIDRELTTKLLGFQKVMPHGHDATSSRDFMLEVLSAISIMQTTISRYAEELIFFSSYEFQTVTLDDGFAMGSSMMPQKKNPGSVELLRGRTGRINGLLTAGLTLMKGLPSAYNRDFHEEKEILMESLNLINGTTSIIPELTRTLTFNLKRMHELAYGNFATATEVANFLVAKNNVPFRQAHHIVGSLVGELSRSGRNFRDWEACVDWIINKNGVKADPNELKKVFDPKFVMMSYNSLGGTGPIAVKKMIADFTADLERHKKILNEDKARTEKAFDTVRDIATKAGSVKSAQELLNLVPQEYRTKK